MNTEEKAEELINDFICILEDVGTVPSEVRREAIRCSLLLAKELKTETHMYFSDRKSHWEAVIRYLNEL